MHAVVHSKLVFTWNHEVKARWAAVESLVTSGTYGTTWIHVQCSKPITQMCYIDSYILCPHPPARKRIWCAFSNIHGFSSSSMPIRFTTCDFIMWQHTQVWPDLCAPHTCNITACASLKITAIARIIVTWHAASFKPPKNWSTLFLVRGKGSGTRLGIYVHDLEA